MDLTKAKIAVIILKMAKEWDDIRGKEFAKNYLAFIDVMDVVFQLQYESVIHYIDQNPHLFASKDGIILEKTDYLGKAWDESNSNHIKTLFFEGYSIGQVATNEEVKPEVNILMEIDNKFAKDYAENHA